MINRKRIIDRRRIITILTRGMLGSIGILIVGAGLISIAGLNDNIDRSDVAVVLGNTVDPNGKPSARLQARLDKTIELYRRGIFKPTFC
jgi:hypothetical protein